MEKRNIPISIPSMGVEEWEALRAPIESGWITQGPKVKEETPGSNGECSEGAPASLT